MSQLPWVCFRFGRSNNSEVRSWVLEEFRNTEKYEVVEALEDFWVEPNSNLESALFILNCIDDFLWAISK